MSLNPPSINPVDDMPKIHPLNPGSLPDAPPLEDTLREIETIFTEIATTKHAINGLQRSIEAGPFKCISLPYSVKSRFGRINKLQKRLFLLQDKIHTCTQNLNNHCFSAIAEAKKSPENKVINICSRLLHFLNNEPETECPEASSLWKVYTEETPVWIPTLEKAGNVLIEASTQSEISQLSDFLSLLFKSDHNEMAFSLISKFSNRNPQKSVELFNMLLPSIPTEKIDLLEKYCVSSQEKTASSSIAEFYRNNNSILKLHSLGLDLLPFAPYESAQIAFFLIEAGDFTNVMEIAEYLAKPLPDFSVRIAHQCLHNGHNNIQPTIQSLSQFSPDHAIDLMILLLEHGNESPVHKIAMDWNSNTPTLIRKLTTRCKSTGQAEFAENLLLDILEKENTTFLKNAQVIRDFSKQDMCLGTIPRLTIELSDDNSNYPEQMGSLFDKLCNNIPPRSKPRLRSGLMRMCNTIKTKPNSFSGIPDDPNDRKEYYATLEKLLINVLALLSSEDTPSEARELTLSILGEGGHLCAGRFTSELHGAYSFLSGESSSSWEHLLPTQKIQSTLQILRNAIVEEICHKICRGNSQLSHSMIAMRKLVANELALPTADQIDIADRYQHLGKIAEKKEEILDLFFKQYTPQLIIERIKDHTDLDRPARAKQSIDLTDLLMKFAPQGINKHSFLNHSYEDEEFRQIKGSIIAYILKKLKILEHTEI